MGIRGKKCRDCREGKLMQVSGLWLPREPDMGSYKSNQITHDGMQVIWLKVQGARVFHNSSIHPHLYLANASAHWVPWQLFLEGGEELSPLVEGRFSSPAQPVTVAGVNVHFELIELCHHQWAVRTCRNFVQCQGLAPISYLIPIMLLFGPVFLSFNNHNGTTART